MKSEFTIKKLHTILIISILVIGMIGIFLYAKRQQKAEITTANLKSVHSGTAIELPLYIDTKDATINAAEIYLKFDNQAIQVKSVSKENSFFKLWITDQPNFSNERGGISFAGGLPTPGFKGKGQIGAVVLTVQKPGTAKLTFDPKTRILLNDGKGTVVPLRIEPIIIQAK